MHIATATTCTSYGIGFTTGYNDENHKDVGLYFDIFLRTSTYKNCFGDLDRDGLSEYSEAYTWYSTIDGEDTDSDGCTNGWDSDNDGLPDSYDKIHGLLMGNSISNANLLIKDEDIDGINTLDEYKYYEYGANPNRKDIFVEMDWMTEVISTDGSGMEYQDLNPSYVEVSYKIQEYSKIKSTVHYLKAGVALHIDDGCMGGGNKLDYDYKLDWNPTGFDTEGDEFYKYKWGEGWNIRTEYLHSAPKLNAF